LPSYFRSFRETLPLRRAYVNAPSDAPPILLFFSHLFLFVAPFFVPSRFPLQKSSQMVSPLSCFLPDVVNTLVRAWRPPRYLSSFLSFPRLLMFPFFFPSRLALHCFRGFLQSLFCFVFFFSVLISRPSVSLPITALFLFLAPHPPCTD